MVVGFQGDVAVVGSAAESAAVAVVVAMGAIRIDPENVRLTLQALILKEMPLMTRSWMTRRLPLRG